jgi:excisionase family DNA binding protein
MTNTMNVNLPEGTYKTIPQMVKALNMNRQTVYGWIRRGLLRSYRVGGTYRVYDGDFQDFLNRCNR